jgi:hypothetical protein
MNTKLTLKLDKNVIQKAKAFARNNNVSLSALVEHYFDSITKKKNLKYLNLTPTVKALSGSLQPNNKVKPDDVRDEYLIEKYLHE